MTKTRKVRIASVVAGLLLSLFMAAPVAHADVLADIRGTVTADRLKYGPACPPLKYNSLLQDIGFAQGQAIPLPQAQIDGMIASYRGEVRSFIGVGDPMAAARTDAYKKGAGSLIGNCGWTEFGVSFVRQEATETDWVGIVFGKPAGVTTPESSEGQGQAPGGGGTPGGGQPPVEPPKPQTRQCPPGGLKSEVPVNEKCPAPTNAVAVTFTRSVPQWTVNVKNNAGIGGSCTYNATDNRGLLPGVTRNFDIAPNGTANFQVLAPPPLSSWNVLTVCTGTYDGQQVEFGRNPQTVP